MISSPVFDLSHMEVHKGVRSPAPFIVISSRETSTDCEELVLLDVVPPEQTGCRLICSGVMTRTLLLISQTIGLHLRTPKLVAIFEGVSICKKAG